MIFEFPLNGADVLDLRDIDTTQGHLRIMLTSRCQKRVRG